MANNFHDRIEELEKSRRKNLREAKRARKRRATYLRKRQWKQARNARAVAEQNNKAAQEDLRKLRVLRKERRERSRLARLLRHRRSAGTTRDGHKLYWFDGVRVRAEIYPHLVWARANGWKGRVVSGYRDPIYSQSLCRAMCGYNSCRGTCAGVSSNHVRIAIDVTDYYTFAALMRRCPHKPRIYNDLPKDRVHFSPNGH